MSAMEEEPVFAESDRRRADRRGGGNRRRTVVDRRSGLDRRKVQAADAPTNAAPPKKAK